MGIETILIVFGLVIVAAIWGMSRKNRHGGGSDHDSSPPRLSER
jgi:hypothetical protein